MVVIEPVMIGTVTRILRRPGLGRRCLWRFRGPSSLQICIRNAKLQDAMALLECTLASSVRAAAREFPAVVVTGPRQSGKTTLLRQIVGKRGSYVSLDV